jgi:hypothetical protein
MPIYLPKEIVPIGTSKLSPLFFLGGPIRGGDDWQADMSEEIFRQNPHADIACPCRWDSSHRLARYFHHPFIRGNIRQLIFERHYLQQAGLAPDEHGCIIFWLGLESIEHPHPGPEPYAMDTRRELGKFTAFAELMNVRMVVGGDCRFFGLDVILFELSEAIGSPFPFYETMEDTVKAALAVAKR